MNSYEGFETADAGTEAAGNDAREAVETEAREEAESAEAAETEVNTGTKAEPASVEASIAEAFEQELAEARRKADEHWDRVLRAEADLANFKKASERARKDALNRQRRDLMARFLEISDNLDLAARFEDADREALLEGLAGIRREIARIFEGEGIQRIEAEGADFDPNLHDAVSVLPMPDLDAEKVIAVERAGYTLDGGLLRPARVIVGRPAEGAGG